MAQTETVLLDREAIRRVITRITHEILEKNKGCQGLVLMGIRSGGDHLASLIRQRIADIEGAEVPQGAIDVTLYRDDVATGQPR
ncbi:MAG: bifunctional pyr operon transcriptional regulator/uracil phosphoribosyltransferase, partial [Desulfuromonas thiophila]|nr:bifunctional pyr operon transcriptional regulator/uracil phosphoribosyltransferase [Desulfuromonas thiophila]